MSTPTISQVAARAAEIIRTEGWWRAHDLNQPGECAGLACDRAISELLYPSDVDDYEADDVDEDVLSDLDIAVRNALVGRIAPGAHPSWRIVYDWNDAPGRTQDEVLALLDQVAEAA